MNYVTGSQFQLNDLLAIANEKGGFKCLEISASAEDEAEYR